MILLLSVIDHLFHLVFFAMTDPVLVISRKRLYAVCGVPGCAVATLWSPRGELDSCWVFVTQIEKVPKILDCRLSKWPPTIIVLESVRSNLD
jgi:hypothetical protein